MRMGRLDDAQAIAAYHHTMWLEESGPRLSSEALAAAKPQVERFRQWLTPGSGLTTVVIADDDDLPIAHTTVQANKLVHLFVHPDYQAAGRGRSLLTIGEALIHDSGYSSAELHTRVGNHRAIGLYRSAGWVMTDEVVMDPLPDGSAAPEHVLRKQL